MDLAATHHRQTGEHAQQLGWSTWHSKEKLPDTAPMACRGHDTARATVSTQSKLDKAWRKQHLSTQTRRIKEPWTTPRVPSSTPELPRLMERIIPTPQTLQI
eukprot:8871753-Alexandrium_andersonii.AAC.1